MDGALPFSLSVPSQVPGVNNEPQKEGMNGGRYSLQKLAELATRYRDDPRIDAFVGLVMRHSKLAPAPRDMSPEAQVDRAKAIVDAIKYGVPEIGFKGLVWMPDPHRIERIKSPYLMLPDGKVEPFFVAGDCDDLTAATLCALLNCFLTVDIACAALGHGYHQDMPAIEHVLLAVAKDPSWTDFYRVDPSQDLAFGETTPWQWERVILVPSLELVCDARTCLGTPAMDRGLLARKDAPVDTMQVVGAVPQTLTQWREAPAVNARRSLGRALGRVGSSVGDVEESSDVAKWWRDQCAFVADQLDQKIAAVKDIEDKVLPAMLGVTGGVAPWDGQTQKAVEDAFAAAVVAAPILREAAQGKRRILIAGDGSGDVAIEALPTDTMRISVDASKAPFVEDAKTGAALTGPIRVEAVGVAQVIVVAGAIGFAALHIAAALLVLKTLDAIITTVLSLTGNLTAKVDADCVKEHGPEKCAKLKEAQATAEKARAAVEEANARKVEALTSLGKGALVVVGVSAVIGGLVWGYQELKAEGVIKKLFGGMGGRSHNPTKTFTNETLDRYKRERLAQYVETMLWSNTDDDGEPLDRNYSMSDISDEALAIMSAEVEDFVERAGDDGAVGDQSDLIHDFVLTRNREGAGFWDGDWPEPEATRLTELAHSYHETNLVVGDDGELHLWSESDVAKRMRR